MWVIFVLSAMIFSVVGLFIVYLANKIINIMRKENFCYDMIIGNNNLKDKEKENK